MNMILETGNDLLDELVCDFPHDHIEDLLGACNDFCEPITYRIIPAKQATPEVKVEKKE